MFVAILPYAFVLHGQILSSRVFCLALRPLRYSTLGSGLFGSGTATVSGTVRDAESSEILQ